MDSGGAQTPENSTLFLPGGAPNRPTNNLKIKEAGTVKLKKGSDEQTIGGRAAQPAGVLKNPRADHELPPPGSDETARVRVRFPHLTEPLTGGVGARTVGQDKGGGSKSTQTDDDAALNAAACRTLAAANRPLPLFCRTGSSRIDHTVLDRMDADRVDQLQGRPGGFNPNKP
jgi:hypothetical protein